MLLLFVLVCAQSALAAGGWAKQKSGTLVWLRAVYFLDAERGWVVGGGGILLATADGGETWKTLRPPTEDGINDIYFTDEQNGWLVCERSQYLLKTNTEQRSYLMKTADGGENWQRVNLNGDPDARLLRVLLTDEGHGWVFGEGGMIFTTENGGQTWLKRRAPTRHILFGGAFLDQTQLWLVGAGATIIQTKDGGETWRTGNVLGITESVRFNAASFVDRSRGWAVGNNGSVFLTADGGRTWQAQTSNVDEDLHDVKFLNAAEGWAVGAGGILIHTTDGGFHWTEEQSGTTHPLSRLFFAGRERGWAVGFGGTIISYAPGVTNKTPALKQPPVLKGAKEGSRLLRSLMSLAFMLACGVALAQAQTETRARRAPDASSTTEKSVSDSDVMEDVTTANPQPSPATAQAQPNKSHPSNAKDEVRTDRISLLRSQIRDAKTEVERVRYQRTLVDYLIALNRQSEAATELANMLTAEHLDAASYYNIGNGLARLGAQEQAVEAYRKAIDARQGNYSRALNNMGVVLFELGRTDEAFDAFVLAIKQQNFRYAEANYNLGKLYAARDEADLAISEWTRALAVQPDHVDAAVALARAYAVTGKPERGLEVIDATLKRVGTNEKLETARAEIASDTARK